MMSNYINYFNKFKDLFSLFIRGFGIRNFRIYKSCNEDAYIELGVCKSDCQTIGYYSKF